MSTCELVTLAASCGARCRILTPFGSSTAGAAASVTFLLSFTARLCPGCGVEITGVAPRSGDLASEWVTAILKTTRAQQRFFDSSRRAIESTRNATALREKEHQLIQEAEEREAVGSTLAARSRREMATRFQGAALEETLSGLEADAESSDARLDLGESIGSFVPLFGRSARIQDGNLTHQALVGSGTMASLAFPTPAATRPDKKQAGTVEIGPLPRGLR